jgi:hypothetical protein
MVMMNRKQLISLLLVVLLLALTATPSLGWHDVGTDDFRASQCVVEPGMSPDSCVKINHDHSLKPGAEYPFSLLRAE